MTSFSGMAMVKSAHRIAHTRLAWRSTSPVVKPVTSELRPPVPSNSSKTTRSWPVPNLIEIMSMNRKSSATISRTLYNTRRPKRLGDWADRRYVFIEQHRVPTLLGDLGQPFDRVLIARLQAAEYPSNATLECGGGR